MIIIGSYEQFCPKCNRNITLEEIRSENGDVTVKCAEKKDSCEKCKLIIRLNEIHRS